MQFSRYMSVSEFARELSKLGVYRGEYVGSHLLESLDAAGLLRPRIRVHFPDEVARRFWQEKRDHIPYRLKLAIEPDGPRWDAALALENAFRRWHNYYVYGLSVHPLDNPESWFASFVEHPQKMPFRRWLDRRVDVSNDI
jgi:hypothetical protein